MKNLRNSFIAALIACAPAAYAHEDHAHAAKHGGKIVESGHHRLEILVRDGALEVYVDGDGGHAEDVQNSKATAAILTHGKKQDVVLTPDQGNFLKGTGSFKIAKGTTIVVTLTMPGHEPEQARVTLD
jgi:hypothetical protein